MTREEAIEVLSHEIKLATLNGKTQLESALRWAVNDMATSNNWDKICQDLWIENEKLTKKGKWIDKDDPYFDYYICTECGLTSSVKTTYCPACGAKMTEDENADSN